ncbi:unnamed protein product, partial [marine sediment metagenome]
DEKILKNTAIEVINLEKKLNYFINCQKNAFISLKKLSPINVDKYNKELEEFKIKELQRTKKVIYEDFGLDKKEISQPIIGASGAISGVMAAYLLLYWKSSIKVLMFFTITKIPALIFIALWFIYQVVYGMGSLVHPVSLENVGWFAHIGGFLMGIALTILLPKNPKRFIKKYRRIEI